MQACPRSSTELSAFEAAIEQLETCGFMLARLETLMKAVRDKRLDRTCLLVLAVLIEHMNKETLTTWVGRKTIADLLGITEKTVSNCLWRLSCLGYIVSARLPTPQANNRVMLHHTLSALSPEELEAAIARAVSSIKGEVSSVVAFPTSRPDGKSCEGIPPVGTGSRPDGVPAPTGTQSATSRPNGNTEAASSRPDGYSNSKSKTTTVGARGVGAGEGGEGRPRSQADGTENAKGRSPFTIAETRLTDEAVAIWNTTAERLRLSRCQTVTPQRRSRLLKRLADIGGLDQFKLALSAIERWPFLAGKVPPKDGREPFKLDIGLLLQTDGNLGDVLANLIDRAGDGAHSSAHDPSQNAQRVIDAIIGRRA